MSKDENRSEPGSRDAVFGIAWYTPDEWIRVREASIDPEIFDDTYAEWQSEAEAALRRFRDQGMEVRRVYVAASDLVAWCKERGLPIDAKARSQYAAEGVRKRARQ